MWEWTIAGTPVSNPFVNPDSEGFFMFKQLNRWLIAWPLVALLFVAGCGEEKYTGPESWPR